MPNARVAAQQAANKTKSMDDTENDEAMDDEDENKDAMDDEDDHKAMDDEDDTNDNDDDDKDAAAASAERNRIDAILNCAEAKGREKLARHFATKTGMPVKDAKAALAAAPTDTGGLDAAMGADGNADIGPGSGQQKADSGWGRSIAKLPGAKTQA